MNHIHRIDEVLLYNTFKNNGIRIFDALVFFSNPFVRENYGIRNVGREKKDRKDVIVFEIKDSKKFFLKCIKYGI